MTLKLKIDGMHCSSCAKVISLGLEELTGVGKIVIDEKSKLAEIEFDENKISQDKILETIRNSGYTPNIYE